MNSRYEHRNCFDSLYKQIIVNISHCQGRLLSENEINTIYNSVKDSGITERKIIEEIGRI